MFTPSNVDTQPLDTVEEGYTENHRVGADKRPRIRPRGTGIMTHVMVVALFVAVVGTLAASGLLSALQPGNTPDAADRTKVQQSKSPTRKAPASKRPTKESPGTVPASVPFGTSKTEGASDRETASPEASTASAEPSASAPTPEQSTAPSSNPTPSQPSAPATLPSAPAPAEPAEPSAPTSEPSAPEASSPVSPTPASDGNDIVP